MSNVQRLVGLINETPESEANFEKYENIYILLKSLSPNENAQLSEKVDLTKFFLSINLSKSSHARIALDLARIIFTSIDFLDFSNSHIQELNMALRSNDEIACFILEKLDDNLRTSKNHLSGELYLPILECMTRKSITVTKLAMKVIISATISSNYNFISDNKVKELIDAQGSSIVKLRLQEVYLNFNNYFKLFVELSCISPDFFDIVIGSNILQILFDELSSQDLLVQVNSITILQHLASTKHGHSYLKNNGIITNILKVTHDLLKDPLSDLLLPGYLTFLCVIAHHHYEDWLRNELLTCIFNEILQGKYSSCYSVCIEGLAFIASNKSAVYFFDEIFKHGTLIGNYFKILGDHIISSTGEIRVKCLDAFNMIFFVKNLSLIEAINEPYRIWFEKIGDQRELVSSIFSYIKQPFPDIRLSSLKALKSISSQVWGPEIIFNFPGLMEYMLDRSTEDAITENKSLYVQEKFDFVSTLFKTCEYIKINRNICLVNIEQDLQIRLYLREGPWGIRRSEATVAMES